ncbi:hypothetical protein TRVL_07579 [Trypanosoma vivax]|nr:hypothetical protein TRVL_07579 [Trypanosoma vivax]
MLQPSSPLRVAMPLHSSSALNLLFPAHCRHAVPRKWQKVLSPSSSASSSVLFPPPAMRVPFAFLFFLESPVSNGSRFPKSGLPLSALCAGSPRSAHHPSFLQVLPF